MHSLLSQLTLTRSPTHPVFYIPRICQCMRMLGEYNKANKKEIRKKKYEFVKKFCYIFSLSSKKILKEKKAKLSHDLECGCCFTLLILYFYFTFLYLCTQPQTNTLSPSLSLTHMCSKRWQWFSTNKPRTVVGEMGNGWRRRA